MEELIRVRHPAFPLDKVKAAYRCAHVAHAWRACSACTCMCHARAACGACMAPMQSACARMRSLLASAGGSLAAAQELAGVRRDRREALCDENLYRFTLEN